MKRRRGFTLAEMLLAVSLLGVFSLLAYRLVGANFDITQDTLRADSNAARFDRAVFAMREDVSGSASLEISGPALLRIHGSGNQLIEWHIDHNTLVRTAASEHRSWDVGHPLTLKLDGAVVLLSTGPDDQIAMASLPKGGPR